MHPVGRQVGVAIPTQSTEQAPVMTVTHVAPIQFVGLEYGDQSGRKHTTLGMIIGDKVYEVPNGEALAAGMNSFVSAISKQVLDKIELSNAGKNGAPPAVPKEDNVDIMAASSDDDLVAAQEKKAKSK